MTGGWIAVCGCGLYYEPFSAMLKKTIIRFCENDLKSYFHFLNYFYVKNIHRGLAQNWHPSDTGNLFWKWKIYHKWPHFLVMFYEIKRKSETSTKHPSKTWVKLHQTLPKIGWVLSTLPKNKGKWYIPQPPPKLYPVDVFGIFPDSLQENIEIAPPPQRIFYLFLILAKCSRLIL